MDVFIREELELRKDDIIDKIEEGALFIHPTDTIYGLGCNALEPKAVARLREVKGCGNKPLSVIAPDKEWIEQHLVLNQKSYEWLDKLPGPYTLIIPAGDSSLTAILAPGLATLGVRIPHHWISGFVKELGFPIVTTSANLCGKMFMTSLDDLDEELSYKVDFALYEGEKKARPSNIVDLTGEEKIINRQAEII